VILPPLAEEIMVRGFLYSTFQKSRAHDLGSPADQRVVPPPPTLQEGGDAGLLWIGAVDTFVLSLVLIYLRRKDRQPVGVDHAARHQKRVAFTSLFVLHVR